MAKNDIDSILLGGDISDEEMSSILGSLPCDLDRDDEDINIPSDLFVSDFDKSVCECVPMRPLDYEARQNDCLIRLRSADIAAEHKKMVYEQKCARLDEKEKLRATSAMNDALSWCKINVGGVLFETALGTLKKFPESRIGQIFSGDNVKVDCPEYNNISRDGTHFRQILNYLRSPHVYDIDKLAAYSVGSDNRWELQIEADFYGLHEGMFPTDHPPEKRPHSLPTRHADRKHFETDTVDTIRENIDGEFIMQGLVRLDGGRRGSARLLQKDSQVPASQDGPSFLTPPETRVAKSKERKVPTNVHSSYGSFMSSDAKLRQHPPGKQIACKDSRSGRYQMGIRKTNSATNGWIMPPQIFAIDCEQEKLQQQEADHRGYQRKRHRKSTSSLCSVTVAERIL